MGGVQSGYGGPVRAIDRTDGAFFFASFQRSALPEEEPMADFQRRKLSDAIPRMAESGKKKRGKRSPSPEVAAEQTREAAESTKAREADASPRDRMVDIGRGNQQSGRQRS
jgi:hypothetical protein